MAVLRWPYSPAVPAQTAETRDCAFGLRHAARRRIWAANCRSPAGKIHALIPTSGHFIPFPGPIRLRSRPFYFAIFGVFLHRVDWAGSNRQNAQAHQSTRSQSEGAARRVRRSQFPTLVELCWGAGFRER
jgi:hypothetical protein